MADESLAVAAQLGAARPASDATIGSSGCWPTQSAHHDAVENHTARAHQHLAPCIEPGAASIAEATDASQAVCSQLCHAMVRQQNDLRG
jgi:hypothetical protein